MIDFPNSISQQVEYANSSKAGVSTSCTVRLNNEVYCVHDGDWKECSKGPGVNDLVIAIEKLYNSS